MKKESGHNSRTFFVVEQL